MRIAPGADGVSIWSSEIFGSPEGSRIQDFLSRIFAVGEVERVELRRAADFGRIHYRAVANPRRIWKKLGRALSEATDAPLGSETEGGPVRRIDAGLLHLDRPRAEPVHVSRIGSSLSTWRVRHQSEDRLHLWHPVLRNRRDVVFRLEEELAAILGVQDFRANAFTAGVAIRFDKAALTVEQLVGELEKAWPRLLEGLEGPPSRKRFVAAGALLVLAFTGQYLVPALRRVAVAGVVVYSAPNVVNGARQLARGQVGLYVLYSVGLGFMLASGLPFASTAITVLMQFWPRLARRKFVSSQRRLFAPQRRRPVWARTVKRNGTYVEVSVHDLRKDDLVVVRSGETVPVDGVIREGAAAVVAGAPFGADHVEQRSQGDWIGAGAFVRDGSLTIRVERAGWQTSASYLASLLPHAPLPAMPSLIEVERIANRNAKPTLALSAATLALSRTSRPAQAVLRPDFVTAPRLSAQLSALQALARGAQEGIFFRDPASLDRLGRADVYVIDDTAGLERRGIEVAAVRAVKGIAEGVIADYALAARETTGTDQSLVLATFTSGPTAARPKGESVRHHAGVARYRDHSGAAIEVATAQHVAASKIGVPPAFRQTLAQHAMASEPRSQIEVPAGGPSLRPLWVSRNGEVIGVVSFARTGEMVGKRVVAAIKAQDGRARLVYLSRHGEAEAQALARALGIDSSYGALEQAAKADLIRGVRHPAVWVGDGTDPESREPIAASTVSVSVAGPRGAPQDLADILLTRKGLDGLPAAIDIARAHDLRLTRDYRTVYTANLLAVGGALSARLNALQTGLLSNVGTGLVYARHARALDRLAGRGAHPAIATTDS
jgi:cation transport ATPase